MSICIKKEDDLSNVKLEPYIGCDIKVTRRPLPIDPPNKIRTVRGRLVFISEAYFTVISEDGRQIIDIEYGQVDECEIYTEGADMNIEESTSTKTTENDSFDETVTKVLRKLENEGKVVSTPVGIMSADRFKQLLEELDGNSVKTLAEKNARYSSNGDALHNFRSGAEIAGGTTAQACWGYLTKHLVALRDMVERDDFSNREDFLEKCQDTINYIRFLWCIGNE